jgi:hypothetical protein
MWYLSESRTLLLNLLKQGGIHDSIHFAGKTIHASE